MPDVIMPNITVKITVLIPEIIFFIGFVFEFKVETLNSKTCCMGEVKKCGMQKYQAQLQTALDI